jgi:8-oxo-dGTP pyrophosphatase MutT (NUDIX family)
MRELEEETGINIELNLSDIAGTLYFIWPHKPDWHQTATIFVHR